MSKHGVKSWFIVVNKYAYVARQFDVNAVRVRTAKKSTAVVIIRCFYLT